jgi:glutathione S-transferase
MSVAVGAHWKLYGVPLSQPFRSVAWALLQNHIRFDVQLVLPGAANKIGSRNEAYRSLSKMKSTRIPLLQDVRTGFTVAESPAILSYLCDCCHGSSSTTALYAPPGSTKRATIDSYMHWHHTGTRRLSSAVFPYLRQGEDGSAIQDKEKGRKTLEEILQSLEEGWFSSLATTENNDTEDCFLAGGTQHSIADLLAYEEICQLYMLGVVPQNFLQQTYPRIHAWTIRMAQLPYHEQVHVSMLVLGDVTVDSDVPLVKRLGTANKAALQALKEAQRNFEEPSSTPKAKL